MSAPSPTVLAFEIVKAVMPHFDANCDHCRACAQAVQALLDREHQIPRRRIVRRMARKTPTSVTR